MHDPLAQLRSLDRSRCGAIGWLACSRCGAIGWLACVVLAFVTHPSAHADDDVCSIPYLPDGRVLIDDIAADGTTGAVALPVADTTHLPLDRFVQTGHEDAVFVGMFAPHAGARWSGNLKRYRLRLTDGAVLDAEGRPALEPETGRVASGARSYWSASPDGDQVEAGGAASRLPPPETRNVYTYLGATRLDTAINRVSFDNVAIDEHLLGLDGENTPSREEVIAFIQGSGAESVTETAPSRGMGAVLRTPPVAAVHGPSATDVTVYVVTDDGYLHAVDAATGVEHWAFVPPELMSLQAQLLKGAVLTGERYGIDGGLSVRLVADGDTAEHPRVHLYFGLGRGGNVYYGLDVTQPRNPHVLWRLGGDELPGLGQGWSSPVPARLAIAGAAQSPDLGVLVLSGGYDPAHDTLAPGAATLGNAIYVVDATSGQLLWHGAASGRDASFGDMRHPIPAEVRVVDLTGDGLTDRWYAADLGGQVWRFDIFNGNEAGRLVAGSVMARLGTAGASDPLAHARRFFNAPDVALALRPNGAYVHLGIGSGHRPRPNTTAHHDRFYALRDHRPFAVLDQTAHDAVTPVRDAELADITDHPDARVPPGGPGWKLELREGGWRGEKVLAEARTFDDKVYFATFTPDGDADPGACEPLPLHGTTRLYVVDLDNGAPSFWVADAATDASGPEATEPGSTPAPGVNQRYRVIPGAPAERVRFVLAGRAEAGDCAEGICRATALACVGLACFVTGFESRPVRTYWSEDEGYRDDDIGG